MPLVSNLPSLLVLCPCSLCFFQRAQSSHCALPCMFSMILFCGSFQFMLKPLPLTPYLLWLWLIFLFFFTASLPEIRSLCCCFPPTPNPTQRGKELQLGHCKEGATMAPWDLWTGVNTSPMMVCTPEACPTAALPTPLPQAHPPARSAPREIPLATAFPHEDRGNRRILEALATKVPTALAATMDSRSHSGHWPQLMQQHCCALCEAGITARHTHPSEWILSHILSWCPHTYL